MKLAQLLDRPIAYHRSFVAFGGATVAIFLSQSIYWSNRTSDENGWFYKTRDEWEEETGLTRREQEGARKKLRELKIIEEELRGVPAKLYYRVNLSLLTSLLKTAQLVGTKPPNWMVQNRPTIYTETTTETTPYIKDGAKEKISSPIIKDGYSITKHVTSTKKTQKEDNEPIEEAKAVLESFNQVYGTNHKAVSAITGNLKHWLETYTVADIQKAIEYSKHDKFWKSKLTPTILLRRMNPNREPVDYIGQFLNMNVNIFDNTPLTDLEQWEVAAETDVHPQDVADKHRAVLEEASRGGNVTQRYPNVRSAVTGWVRFGIEKGEIQTLGEFRDHTLRENHPEFRKKLAEAKALLKAQGKL